MKQIKFRHLATLGLCCSLLANSFTGITAIAETVTIESSPTAETVASETTETEKKTKVEQTEQTKEAKNQQEHKETEATSQDTSEEDNQKEVAQPTEATTSSLEETLPKIESRGIPLKTVVYPKVQYDFVDETGAPFTTPLSFFTGNYQAHRGGTGGEIVTLPAPYNKLSAQINGTGSYILSINNSTGVPLTPQMLEKYGPGGTTPNNKYYVTFRLDKLSIATSLKFVDSIKYEFTGSYWSAYRYKGYHLITGIFDNSIEKGEAVPLNETNSEGNVDMTFKKNASGFFEIIRPNTLAISSGDHVGSDYAFISLYGFDGTNTIKSKMVYKVTRKQVTEKFVDGAGVAITPPTGFTQNKKTPMTNNNFTYTSAKALPDTYQANGKTYKFKGWYKGKTKPATLKTTKTPSYAVTYDSNDDLNVVYEEIEAFDFPALTYQFGFVDESGKRVDASTIGLTYDKWYGELLTGNVDDWKTVSLEKGQIAPTKNNLKEIAYPAQSLERLSGRSSQYSAVNITFTLPKYYENISITNKSGTFDVAYPFPSIYANNRPEPNNGGTSWAQLKKSGSQSFIFNKTTSAAPIDIQVPSYLREIVHNPDKTPDVATYYTLDKPIYYYLTNRKVTENFVDASGTKITPPTGFTQGNKVVIDSENFTYTSPKALPDTYKVGDKTYKFKGWYKGKTKPATLETSKTPSYKVTYDDTDDLNVVYEEIEAFDFPALTYQFGFVDESGKRVDASTIGLTYDKWLGELLTGNDNGWKTVSLEKGQVAPTKNNLKEIAYPAQSLEILSGQTAHYSAANLTFTLPKYYEKISVYNKSGTFDTAYPFPNIQNNNYSKPYVEDENKLISKLFELKNNGGQSFIFNQPFEVPIDIDIHLPRCLRVGVHDPRITSTVVTYYTIDKPIYYYLTNRKVTENFVDASGTKITPPTGFTQGNQIPMTSDTFKYTAAKALPTSYTADGKTYLFQGWYKGKTKPNTLTTSTTPTYDTTFDDNDDMTAVYKEASISANLTMRGAVDVIDNGGTMEYWEVLLKNTGEAPLTSIKIKPTTEWESGISTPTELFILGTGQNTKVRPITKEQWEAGFEIPLDKSLPVGGQLTINLIGTKVTGQPNQVLKAAVEVSGNFNKLTASDTVRIKDLDQETKEPTGEGFISVPTFDFGQVGVASATKQHGLKKAADYYGNGTRNPYVRISKNQPNWSLTAQLSQPKSATDSLPTATRLLLGAAPVSSFSNYNQPTELKNAIGTTNAINLTANNAATSIIANQQFTGSDVYQLDFTFDNIKLEVPANQGTAGQQYQAAVTWNLVTGP
ncbi:WxL domain-containing protein [Enterococcus faecalis]|uniref:WxL domain-containing protein n=7 Tax=Enterococcus faecalis TaxID=1351 RepID=UPI000CF21D6D|nr:WxL domain-containing protein [Enterococcus faecalis]EGO2632173.1 WxL domain-containing protein [Enterococcus faecalis]EGO7617016.1 WxL domain-containing protein [Enterococcus faecalis]EGO7911775.1 WxL domain-containing protein [Enterococcus faecalis]EHG5970408.1 WxL domain-containing protein [Enterococcus faecalis]EHU8862785.1 WxL domain-containing protein [Enterococcus faecalis]